MRRVATLTIQCEQLETSFAETPATVAQLDTYQKLSNTLRRLLATLGTKRRANDVTPDLQSYLRNRSNQRVTLEHDG